MRVPTSLRWVALALLGLVIAIAIAIAASSLASQQIGIASESVSAGDTLAPPITPTHARRHPGAGGAAERTEPTERTEPIKPHERTEPTEAVEPELRSYNGGEDGGQTQGGGGPDD
ncbi:MAG: hypothetical protein JSU06_04455 [Actinobacteria bacterium]|nr:hypothetical protein [Actinomycetota bacterium]